VNTIWIVDDNSETRHDIEQWIEKRIRRSLGAGQWATVADCENPAEALAALKRLSAEDRSAVKAAVFDLYAPALGPAQPNRAVSDTEEFQQTVVKAVELIGDVQKLGVKIVIYTLVFKYCEEKALRSVYDAVKSAIERSDIKFETQVVHKTESSDNDLERVWGALQRQTAALLDSK